MGDFPAWDPNKQLFGASQQTNPYSLYSGQALPWPTPYDLGGLSAPTDAKGNPIASYQAPQATQQWVPGTTINSGPVAGAGNAPGNRYNLPDNDMQFAALLDPTGFGSTPFAKNQMQNYALAHGGGGSGQTTTTPGSWQTVQPSAADQAAAYINALGAPGKVTTAGANVAPSAAQYQPSSGVLDAYLANNKTGGFADTVNALRAKRQA